MKGQTEVLKVRSCGLTLVHGGWFTVKESDYGFEKSSEGQGTVWDFREDKSG